MGVSNGIISAPINLRDPFICMGLGKYNGGYDLVYLCFGQHGKINPWSKKKPVDSPKIKELTDAEFIGAQNDYNIEIRDAAGNVLNGDMVYSLPNIKKVADYNWLYRPISPANSWGRLTDFIGYYHYAKPWFVSGRASITWNMFNHSQFTVSFSLNSELPSDSPYELKLSDIVKSNIGGVANRLGIYHVAATWVRSDGNWATRAQEDSLANASSLEIPLYSGDDYIEAGYTYDLYVYLANGTHTDPDVSAGLISRILPLPYSEGNLTKIPMNIVSNFPGQVNIYKVGSLLSDNIPDSDIREGKGDVVNYHYQSYWSEEGDYNTLEVYRHSRICFMLQIVPSQTVTLKYDEFRVKRDSSPKKFNLMVQGVNDAHPSNSVSKAITFEAGGAYTLYAIMSEEGSVADSDSTQQFSLFIRGALVCQSVWMDCREY